MRGGERDNKRQLKKKETTRRQQEDQQKGVVKAESERACHGASQRGKVPALKRHVEQLQRSSGAGSNLYWMKG